jgi:hypothetical protein
MRLILLEKDDLTLTTDETLKPATFLAGRQEGGAPEHKCLDIILNIKQKSGQISGKLLSRLGSIKAKRHNGYSIEDKEAMTIIQSGRLPNNLLAQTC